MKIIVKSAVYFVIFFVSVFNAWTQDRILTNEELVRNEVKKSIAQNIQFDSGSSLSVLGNYDGIDALIYNGITSALNEKNYIVYLNSESPLADYKIGFENVGFNFDYSNGAKRGFLKSRMIRRNLKIFLKIYLIENKTNRLLENKNIDIVFHDEIDPGSLKLVGSKNIMELNPDRPNSFMKKVAEPVIIAGAIGTLVFLFFSNR